jgi:hypothetical protein
MVVCALAALWGVLAQQPSPTAPASPSPACPDLQPSVLILNERGRVSTEDPEPLNMRNGPGTDAEIIGQIPAGGIFFPLEGPRCTARYSWFRVIYRSGTRLLQGWVAEGTTDRYFVELFPPGR